MSRTKRIKKVLEQWDQEMNKVKNQQNHTTTAGDSLKEEACSEKKELGTFLKQNYEFRYNVLTEMTEYRPLERTDEAFKVLNERERNTLYLKIKDKGILWVSSGLMDVT